MASLENWADSAANNTKNAKIAPNLNWRKNNNPTRMLAIINKICGNKPNQETNTRKLLAAGDVKDVINPVIL